MCFGGGKKAAAPAPVNVVTQANPNAVADNSNDAQQRAAVVASTTKPQTFGAELGTGQGAPV